MPDSGETRRVKVVSRIAEVAAADWDACAGTKNPFLTHAFLDALEASGSATAKTGWLPQHLLLEDEGGRLVGAVPLYLKSHSYGEYVFDHSWAAAYERAGGDYYPKLLSAVPFTPVPGPRILLRSGAGSDTADLLVAAMLEVARRHKVSSLHVTFPQRDDWMRLGGAGFLQRLGQQYHWENRGYGSFEDFLGALNARKRKSIRRERREVAESGLVLHMLTGSAIEPAHWDAFYRLYMAMTDRKWGGGYLTRDFFRRVGASMADRTLLIMAEDRGRFIAGALNFIGADALYGRNWGSEREYAFLHFEACYYRAIDFAIARGLKRVEAGAQGEHKIQRGYLPVPTYSAHWFRDPGLARAVADFLKRERPAVERQMAMLEEEFSPFRKEPD